MGSDKLDMPEHNGPEYPYGLEISLDNCSLKTMDLSNLDLSKPLEIRGYGKVTRANVDFNDQRHGPKDGPDKMERHISIQITDLGIANVDMEDQPKKISLRNLKSLLRMTT